MGLNDIRDGGRAPSCGSERLNCSAQSAGLRTSLVQRRRYYESRAISRFMLPPSNQMYSEWA